MHTFSALSLVPSDPIFELAKRFRDDPHPRKVNLTQGTYKDGEGKPWVLPSVLEAKRRLIDTDHEYLPILGLPSFRENAVELVFGQDSNALRSGQIASCQALSGTGALHLAGKLLRRVIDPKTRVYITEPTWLNHRAVFETCGFEVHSYNYFLPDSGSLDLQSLLRALKEAPKGSIFVHHACAHNPSGCDPTLEDWRLIAQTMLDRELFPIFDAAYLGLAGGDLDDDAAPIRMFANEFNMEMCVCLSFAKNMGLYGERVGLVAFATDSTISSQSIQSNLEQIQRAEVSNPPAFGAKIASVILSDRTLCKMWRGEHVVMSRRIADMRHRLLKEIEKLNCPKDFQHVVKQRGMFCILGLSREMVILLQKEYHIYMADSSRISVAGLNESNVEYVAMAIDAIVRR